MLTLLVFSFKAGFHIFPPEYDRWEVDLLAGKTKTALAVLIVVITVTQTFLTMLHVQFLAESILFWALTAAIFPLCDTLSGYNNHFISAIFSACIVVNIIRVRVQPMLCRANLPI